MSLNFKEQTWSRVIAIFSGIGGILLVLLITGNFNNPNQQTATTPVVESPSNIATTTPSIEDNVSKLILTPDPYTPSPDVLSNTDAYESQSIRLILNGSFNTARLHIGGVVTDKGNHFLNIVYGNVVGTINGYRSSAKKLNVSLTKENGGVFTSQSPINLKLDLLNPVRLSTTRTEYEQNQQTNKLVNLWQSNLLPPTYINLLVAPFNENGIVGGAQVTLTLEYTCATGYSCQVAVCPTGKITACMRDKFGADAARDWCRRAGYDNCSF